VTSEGAEARRAPRGALALLSVVSLLALGLGVTSAAAVEPKVVVQGRTNSSTSLDVSWTDIKGADAYRVRYSTDDKLKKSVKVLDEVQKGTDATITGLDADKTYYVEVTALDEKGATVGASTVATATTSFPYRAPGDVYASKVTKSSMVLSWKSVGGDVPAYTVLVTLKDKTTTLQTSKTSISLKDLKASTVYSVKVRAANKNGEALSKNSPSQSFSTSNFDLAAPDEFEQRKQRSTSFDVAWDEVAGLGDGDGYVVEWSLTTTFDKPKTTKTIRATKATINRLAVDQTYFARAWVVNTKGKRVSAKSDYITTKTIVPRGTLAGDVSGAPSGDLMAVAYDSRKNAAAQVPVSGGHYELDVRPGTYKVQILYVGTKDDYASTFAHTRGSGWVISQGATYRVALNKTTKVDDVEVKHGNVVKGRVTSGKTKIRDVDVTAISGVDPTNSKAEREVIGMARTDAKGEFTIPGLPDGPYWFRFHYVGAGKGYKTRSDHLEVKDDLGLKVTLKKK
jgi:hypothetical protein